MCHPRVLCGVKGYAGLWFAKLWGTETDIWEPHTQTKTWSSFIWKLKADFFSFLLKLSLGLYICQVDFKCKSFLPLLPERSKYRSYRAKATRYQWVFVFHLCKDVKSSKKSLQKTSYETQKHPRDESMELNWRHCRGNTLVSHRTKAKQAGITVIDRRHVMLIKSYNMKLILLTKTRNQGWVKWTRTQVHKNFVLLPLSYKSQGRKQFHWDSFPPRQKHVTFLLVLTGVVTVPGILCLPCNCSTSDLQISTLNSKEFFQGWTAVPTVLHWV